MKTAILIGALIVFVIAAIVWAATRREGFDNWDRLNIPGNEVKFADRSGGCSAGFIKITDGMRKGLCAPDKYIQGQNNAGSSAPPPPQAPAPRPAPPQSPAPRPAPPRAPAPAPMRKQNWLEKLSESQDPLSAGKGGANAKPVEYNQGSNRRRPNITIASSGSKFRPMDGGKCPAGYSEIMSGSRKGMCIKSEYARGGTPSGPSRMSGSKFSSKVNGQCPNGFSEITAGSRKGMCIKWEYAGKPSGSRSSGSSGSKFTSKIDGRCPSGTTEITAGSRKGQCIKNEARENIESNRKNVGSIYRKKEAASCPKGTTLVKSGSKKGMCIDEGKVVNREYKFWGWGANQGLRCKNSNNTGCETKWVGGKLVDTKKNPIVKKYSYWGWGKNEGLLCSNPNNTGCETKWSGGKLVENKSSPKPAPKPAPKGPFWGWGPHAGMQCKNPDNTGCSFDYAKKPAPAVPNYGSNWTPGWGGNKGMKCRGSVPNTNCTWN